MNKTLKKVLIGLAILGAVMYIGSRVLFSQTKKASPEQTVEYVNADKKIDVFYCAPSKKGREIFGGLAPFDKIWRTGANEATTFETSHDIKVGSQELPAGKYTLWTIPNPEHWTVIFNKKMYGWGLKMNQDSPRKPEFDVLKIDVPVQKTSSVTEMFTIKVDEAPALGMTMAWDQTQIRVPLSW